MIKYALLVTLEAKAGKENEVAKFLKSALPLVEAEHDTITWYALKLGSNKFGIFDTFPHEDGRKAHLAGEVAKALMKKAPDLFAKDPQIQQVDILAVKEAEVKEYQSHATHR